MHDDRVSVVREHARAKARSVADEAGDRPVLAVDTEVVLGDVVFGKPANIRNSLDAIALGLGMVHQEFMLIPGFSIAENVKLNREPTRPSPAHCSIAVVVVGTPPRRAIPDRTLPRGCRPRRRASR